MEEGHAEKDVVDRFCPAVSGERAQWCGASALPKFPVRAPADQSPYVLLLQPPSLAPFDPRITAEFPVCTLDPELWPNQMGAIRHISRVFQLIIQSDFPDAAAPDAVSSSVLSPGALSDPDEEKERLEGVHREMIALDRKVLLSLKELEKKSVREVKKGMGPEEHMAHNFQTSTLMSLSTCEIALVSSLRLA